MAFDFPSSPTVGQEYVSGGTAYVWSGVGWTTKNLFNSADYVKKAGDTMTGYLTLAMNTPWISFEMEKSSNDVAGLWFYDGPAEVPGYTSTRWGMNVGRTTFAIERYDDTGVLLGNPLSISRATGLATISGDPTAPLGIATKQYVDGKVTTGNYVSKTGDTMTGTLNAPTVATSTQLIARGASGALAFCINETSSGFSKYFRVWTDGSLQIINNANSLVAMSLSDAGALGCASIGTNAIAATSLTFGSAVAPGGPTDLSRHISLFGNSYGLSVTANTLNLISGGIRAAWFDGSNWSFSGSCYNNNGRLWGTNDGTPVWIAGSSMTGMLTTNNGTGITTQSASGSLQVLSQTPTTPSITFHRQGAFAMNFGMDLNGNLAFGGWSHGGSQWQLWSQRDGNPLWTSGGTISGGLTVTGACDFQSTTTTRGNHWVWGGVLYMSSGGHYFQWDGSNYHMPHGALYIQGSIAARNGADVSFNQIYAAANVHSNGNHYFLAGDAAWIRWRGDLGRIDTSHGWNFPDIQVWNIKCKWAGNVYQFNWDGTLRAYIDDGDWGSVLNAHSDYRLKKDVTNLDSMWEIVKALRPVKYTSADWQPYSQPNEIEQWGLIAHELQETMLPTAASGYKDCDGAPQQPNPMAIFATVIKALQEAMLRIEQLEAGRTVNA